MVGNLSVSKNGKKLCRSYIGYYMSDTIIKVEGLGKRYTIAHEKRESYTALRDVLSKKVKNAFQRNTVTSAKEDFWALKDVSFEIKQGESVGIIGRNGAGKSTLLKVLSQITEPTEGHIEINGRIASLLEVGTGFHPELTGRENIFLNGAILGMKQSEIKKKFDEIVDFSGIEKFLDTPVKRYSSGMYVRLAFAVAAHLEPEILVVDEVLAVGDAEFQKKCLGKMNEVSKNQGRTVLFVSHNLGAVKQLCNKGIFLRNGRLELLSGAEAVINAYMNSNQFLSKYQFEENDKKAVQITTISIQSRQGEEKNSFLFQEEICFEVSIKIQNLRQGTAIGFFVTNSLNDRIFTDEITLQEISNYTSSPNSKIQISIPARFLIKGLYIANFGLYVPNTEIFDLITGTINFSVEDMPEHIARYHDTDCGSVYCPCSWKFINA